MEKSGQNRSYGTPEHVDAAVAEKHAMSLEQGMASELFDQPPAPAPGLPLEYKEPGPITASGAADALNLGFPDDKEGRRGPAQRTPTLRDFP